MAKALRLLVADPRHPSLQAKKMQPRDLGMFEGRVSQGHRMTFTVAREEIVLRRVGTHESREEALRLWRTYSALPPIIPNEDEADRIALEAVAEVRGRV